MFIRFLPGIPLFSKLMLHPDRPADEETGITAIYHGERLQALLGRVGQTTADLRPAGTARFDDELIDVVSDGTYIKSGTWVVVSEVEGNRVVVHQTEESL
jgi:membrane-bound serine protease (ClpP class)